MPLIFAHSLPHSPFPTFIHPHSTPFSALQSSALHIPRSKSQHHHGTWNCVRSQETRQPCKRVHLDFPRPHLRNGSDRIRVLYKTIKRTSASWPVWFGPKSIQDLQGMTNTCKGKLGERLAGDKQLYFCSFTNKRTFTDRKPYQRQSSVNLYFKPLEKAQNHLYRRDSVSLLVIGLLICVEITLDHSKAFVRREKYCYSRGSFVAYQWQSVRR